MWQRFTEPARLAVFYAQEEAAGRGHSDVSPGALLLGIVRKPDNVGSQLLLRMGIPIDNIRDDVDRSIPRQPGGLQGDMKLTANAKRTIDFAYDEARRRREGFIGTEHLMLAIIRLESEPPSRMLQSHGATIESMRSALDDLRRTGVVENAYQKKPETQKRNASGFEPKTFWDTVTVQARRSVHFAAAEARAQGTGHVTPEHLIAGILREPNTAHTVLESLGVDVVKLKERIPSTNGATDASVEKSTVELTAEARICLITAREAATAARCQFIGVDHLLAGLASESQPIATALGELGTSADALIGLVRSAPPPPAITEPQVELSAAAEVWPPPIRPTPVPNVAKPGPGRLKAQLLNEARIALGIATVFAGITAWLMVDQVTSGRPPYFGTIWTPNFATILPIPLLAGRVVERSLKARRLDNAVGLYESAFGAILLIASIIGLIYAWATI